TTQVCTLSLHDALPILGDVDEDAERVDLGHLEQAVRSAGDGRWRRRDVVDGAPCRDQRAHVDVALDHRAAERGDDALKRGQRQRSEEHTSELQSLAYLV